MPQRRDAVDRRPLGRSDDHGWHYGYLFAPALTVGGGTSEVQRNIVAEAASRKTSTWRPAGPGPSPSAPAADGPPTARSSWVRAGLAG